MSKKSTSELLRTAKDARADLQTFAAVKSILEGPAAPRNMGQVGCHSHATAVFRIIKICNVEIQKALKHMDGASEELERRATQAKQGGAE